MAMMFVATCVVFAHQAGRCEALAAAARYHELLVELPVGASPETRQRAEYLSQLIHILHKYLWMYYAGNGKPLTVEERCGCATNLLQLSSDIAFHVHNLRYRHGLVESWQIQWPLLDVLERDAFRYRKAALGEDRANRYGATEIPIRHFRPRLTSLWQEALVTHAAALATRGLSELRPDAPRPAVLQPYTHRPRSTPTPLHR